MAKLYFYYSTMNAGKSTVLLQANYNYLERGMQTILYAPSVDERYGSGRITSRIGLSAAAKSIDHDFDIFHDMQIELQLQTKIACVLVDEAQFLSKTQVLQLSKVVDLLSIPVLCYGLRTDHKGDLFEGSRYLLGIADNLVEVKTVCHCGRKAIMVMRIDADGKQVLEGPQIQIGGNDLYVATCRKHFMLGDSGPRLRDLQQVEKEFATIA